MTTVNIGGKNYGLRFDGTAAAAVQNKYGDIRKALDEGTKIYADQIGILIILVNEQIAYQNYINGTHEVPLSEKEVGMLLTPYDVISLSIRAKLIGAFNEAWPVHNEKKTE